ncbi:hypothetical protein K7573_05330 [Stenotrophomonas maltophilia]|uniref:hypothetical protein n=1 Tax=Stenotrophomonas maltophilia TaxID=40324 RepID=UPI001D108452|nr:hypothetical protein [Stenotrophomonas maltophilia]UXF77625.1 hypothetical protein K7573_05330 [Stenotrophomonas maltophilia]
MTLTDVLHRLKALEGSSIAEAINSVDDFDPQSLSKREQDRAKLLLLMFMEEAQHEVGYLQADRKLTLDVKVLAQRVSWLSLAKDPPQNSGSTPDLKFHDALKEIDNLIKLVSEEIDKVKDSELGDIKAMVAYFRSSKPSSVAEASWLILVLSLILYLVRTISTLSKSPNLAQKSTEVVSRIFNLREDVKREFPEAPELEERIRAEESDLGGGKIS